MMAKCKRRIRSQAQSNPHAIVYRDSEAVSRGCRIFSAVRG